MSEQNESSWPCGHEGCPQFGPCLFAAAPAQPPAATGTPRMFPIMREYGNTMAYPREIPWSLAELAYSMYVQHGGSGQTLKRVAERGGFYPSEKDKFLPNWREMASDLAAAKAEIDLLLEANAALKEAAKSCPSCGLLLPDHSEDCGRYPLVVEHLRAEIQELRNRQKALVEALILADPFTHVDVSRGPAIDGWQEMRNKVDAALKGES